MSIELKIKAKSLAAEATIIRKEERKQLGSFRWLYSHQRNDDMAEVAMGRYLSLSAHRRGPVRRAARLTALARAYLKGAPYKAVEQPTRNPLRAGCFREVAKMVRRYGGGTEEEALGHVMAWVKG